MNKSENKPLIRWFSLYFPLIRWYYINIERDNEEENKMTEQQLNQLLEELKERFEDELYDYEAVGIRFEDKAREVGEVITDSSKHNIDREDDRDFPEFGTEAYDEMDDLDGVSAWKIDEFEFDGNQNEYLADHCYLIASNDCTFDDGFLMLDEGEVVMGKAVVLAKIF